MVIQLLLDIYIYLAIAYMRAFCGAHTLLAAASGYARAVLVRGRKSLYFFQSEIEKVEHGSMQG